MTALIAPDREIALKTARILLDIGAIAVNAEAPFTLTSGRKSPVYIDCRKIISFPAERRAIMDYAAAILKAAGVTSGLDMVAGGETAGIAYAAWLSDKMDLPMLYVRKKPKGFGRMAQIEGIMEKDGKRVLLVEDLATDGGSKIAFCEVLRRAGARVTDAFCIFYYGIFPYSQKLLEDSGLRLHFLTTWWNVLEAIKERGSFDKKTLGEIERFLADPDGWAASYSEAVPSASSSSG